MPPIREGDVDAAEKAILKYAEKTYASDHPALDYFLGLVEAARKKYDLSGNKFRHVIEAFEENSHALSMIREHIPDDFLGMKMYKDGKLQLGLFTNIKPKELYPIYAMICLIDRDYVGAAFSADKARPHHSYQRRQKLALRIHECKTREKTPAERDGLQSVHDALLDAKIAQPQHDAVVLTYPSHQCSCLCSCHVVLH